MHFIEAGKRPKSPKTCGVRVLIIIGAKALNTIFADGFAVIFSVVVLPVFTDNLKRNSTRYFTKPNKLGKQNEEVFVICRRSMHDNILTN